LLKANSKTPIRAALKAQVRGKSLPQMNSSGKSLLPGGVPNPYSVPHGCRLSIEKPEQKFALSNRKSQHKPSPYDPKVDGWGEEEK